MDKINIKNLEIFAKHGVYSEENVLGQKFIISCTLYTDLRSAGLKDELEKSLDYGQIITSIKEIVENNVYKLIETVAQSIADGLLEENEMLKQVWVEVKKPWAPVAAHLETVSVEILRKKHIAYIALGSNMGDREAYLGFAIDELNKTPHCRVMKVSEFINTEPYGDVEQDDFLNAVLIMETLLSPYELLELVQEIENKADRVRTVRWGPRTLDLDIIFYDDIVLSEDNLRIPHAQAHMRGFVLEPLVKLSPNFMHPLLSKTVSELLDELNKEELGNNNNNES
ncbi:MAG: 2-amino-4-hydroxy-6-hydroxymethyldihydropteridine diphosphokinase [Oscillospiraceae bacterium]|nr:2-amino-4-hydroxy-6-hydroxymethyldihydropteridine diphosphokinase [Oscillospiraceae bacterium]